MLIMMRYAHAPNNGAFYVRISATAELSAGAY
jgi:hypothetical protein